MHEQTCKSVLAQHTIVATTLALGVAIVEATRRATIVSISHVDVPVCESRSSGTVVVASCVGVVRVSVAPGSLPAVATASTRARWHTDRALCQAASVVCSVCTTPRLSITQHHVHQLVSQTRGRYDIALLSPIFRSNLFDVPVIVGGVLVRDSLHHGRHDLHLGGGTAVPDQG